MSPEQSPSAGWRGTAKEMHTAQPQEENTAMKLMDKYGDRIREWEHSDNDVLRELARAIRDNAGRNGGDSR